MAARVHPVTIISEVPPALRQLVRVEGAVPKGWLPKSTRDLLRKLAERRTALQAEKERHSPQAHRRASIQYKDEASVALSLGKESPTEPASAESYDQKRTAARMALELLDVEIDATMRPIVETLVEHLKTYVRERLDVEKSEAELLGITPTPSEIVFKLRYTANQLEAELRSGRGLRGDPANFFKTYGLEL